MSDQTLSTIMTRRTEDSETQGSNQVLVDDDHFASSLSLQRPEDGVDGESEMDDGAVTWAAKLENLLLCCGFVVGVKNVLQFPALAARNGGGAFYCVYLLLVSVVGVPMLYMEMCLGQYARSGPIKAWQLLPLAQGIGFSSVLLSALFTVYNSSYIAWSLLYWFYSMNTVLPWQEGIQPVASGLALNASSITTAQNASSGSIETDRLKIANRYFLDTVLHVSSGLSDTGQLQLPLVVCLFLAWSILTFSVILGPRSMGKVAYIVGITPLLLLIILFSVISSLDGAVMGIRAFLTPRWQVLRKPQTWMDAAMVVLTSLGCGTGAMVTLSTNIHFHSQCFRNALGTGLVSVLGSSLAGCCVFALLGVYSHSVGRAVADLNLTDVELGFVLFPAMSAHLGLPALWSVLFFTMLVLVCVGTQSVHLHAVHSGLTILLGLDSWYKQTVLLFVISLVLFFTSLVTGTQAGVYVVEFLDMYVYTVAVPAMCLLETVAIMWLYGVHRFANNISDMTGTSESLAIKWMWKMCMPVFLIGILSLEFATTGVFGASHRLACPGWLTAIGWLLSCTPPLIGVLVGLYYFVFTKGPLKIRLKKVLHTPHSWGPRPSDEDDDDELPEYVISKPDVHRPVNALALLTANLYLPNFLDITNMERRRESSDLSGTGYLSDLLTVSSSDDESSDDENKARGNWAGHFEFVFSCLGYIVGLGNVWRFPYLVYRNGGGAFFIPYLIMLIFCGLPLVYMELAFGQYASLGPITIWKAVPLFKGIGYAMVLVSGILSIYYNMVNAWAFYYLFTSMTSVLPWQLCTNPWNTEHCRENRFEVASCSAINTSFVNTEQFMNHSASCYSVLQDCQLHNKSHIVECIDTLRDLFGDVVVTIEPYHNRTSPSDEYFYRSVLDASPGLDSIGEIRWQLALCLLLCWGIVFVCLVKGIKSSGKISYLVVSFPYVIIMVLLIRGITMEGNLEGIRYYVTPRWELLARPEVWADAATQVFFTLSACWGGLSTLSSYNKFHNNIYRDAILVCVGDTLMSVLAGFAVFAVIGVLSNELSTNVDKVIQTDVGLTFIVYPAAISYFPVSSLWSVLFFLMLVMMGLGTLFSSVETIVTAIIDENSEKLKKKRIYILLALCIVEFLLGLPLTSQGGIYIVQLMDEYLAGFPHMIISIFMLIAISWVYGVKQFCSNVGHMIDLKVGWWWQAMWRYVSPVIIVFILVFSAVGYMPLKTKFDAVKYPTWSEGLGFLMAFVCVSPIPIYMLYKLATEKGTFMQRVRHSCQAESDWGPALEKNWQYTDYYPTVHAAMLEPENSNIDTITDQVEFTTVGVRVPSLSQTSLLPLSPNLPRTKKPMDMRQKAILNHAYSNPQCNLSTGSVEKLINRQCCSSDLLLSDVIIVPRVRRGVPMRDVATQTELSLLQRQSVVIATKNPEEKKLRRVSWQNTRPQHLSLQCIRNEDNPSSSSCSSSSQRYSWHQAGDHEQVRQTTPTRHVSSSPSLSPSTRASSSRLLSPTRRSGLAGLAVDRKQLYALQSDRAREVSTSTSVLKVFSQTGADSTGDAEPSDGAARSQSTDQRSWDKDVTVQDSVKSDNPSVLLSQPESPKSSKTEQVGLLQRQQSSNSMDSHKSEPDGSHNTDSNVEGIVKSDSPSVLESTTPGPLGNDDGHTNPVMLPFRQQSENNIKRDSSILEGSWIKDVIVEDTVNSESPSVLVSPKSGSQSYNGGDPNRGMLLQRQLSQRSIGSDSSVFEDSLSKDIVTSESPAVLESTESGSLIHDDGDTDVTTLPKRQNSQDSIIGIADEPTLSCFMCNDSGIMSESKHDCDALPVSSDSKHAHDVVAEDSSEHGVCQSPSLQVTHTGTQQTGTHHTGTHHAGTHHTNTHHAGTHHIVHGHREDLGHTSPSDSLVFSHLVGPNQSLQTLDKQLSWQYDGEPAVLEVEMTHL